MDNSSQKHSYTEMVPVYVGDELTEHVTREQARKLKEAGSHYFTSHGKALKAIANTEPLQTEIEKQVSWNIPLFLQNSALNRGKSGQNVVGYPIPYAFEGHLKKPWAHEVNFVPKTV